MLRRSNATKPSTCSTDPIPATIFKEMFNWLVDDVLAIMSHSPLTQIFSLPLNSAIVKPLPQKSLFSASVSGNFPFKVTLLFFLCFIVFCILCVFLAGTIRYCSLGLPSFIFWPFGGIKSAKLSLVHYCLIKLFYSGSWWWPSLCICFTNSLEPRRKTEVSILLRSICARALVPDEGQKVL